jgi:hypothetical protein
MPVAAAVGEKLVSLGELNNITESNVAEIDRHVAEEEVDESFSVELPGGSTIGAPELAMARAAKSETTPFVGIGLGQPLTVTIETVYLGDYPDALWWVPGFDEGDVLVTSAHKAFQTFAGAPRAVHLLQPRAKRRSMVRANAVGQGSQLVYYSPATVDLSVLFTVELSADRDFNAAIGEAFGKAVAVAGALPVFATAAPFLVAAGAAIPIAANAAMKLARPQPFFNETVEISFKRPGVEVAQPGALVLYREDHGTPFTSEYTLGDDFILRDAQDKEYDGPLQYVVLSLDGSERSDLKDWSAEAASAELVKRFHEPDELISQALEVATQGLGLYNDITFREKAAREKDLAKKATGADKELHEKLYQAYLKNIQNKDIRANAE